MWPPRPPERFSAMLGITLIGLLAAGSFEPFYLRMLVADRAAMSAHLTALPYRRLPSLPSFLADANSALGSSQVIIFIAPYARYEQGYKYSFGRAQYVLAAHTVLPLIGSDDAVLRVNLEKADVAVSWRSAPPPGFEIVWEHPEGSVSRRSR